MILKALYELAVSDGLVSCPAYESKPVHYRITVGKDGRFRGIEPLGDESEREWNGFPQLVPRPLPGSRRSGVTIDPNFLIDNASFVLGMNAPADADRKSFDAAELARRLTEFRSMVTAAARETQDAGLLAVDLFLDDLQAGRQEVALPERMLSRHLICFLYSPDIDVPVQQRTEVIAYWDRRISPEREDACGGVPFQCLITGSVGPVSLTHSPVKGVPGGNTAGVRLVSFNDSAFTSYGLEQSENAPVSPAAANAYTEALKRLLDDAFPNPSAPGESLPCRKFRLTSDTVLLFWSATEQEVTDCVGAALREPEKGDEEAKEEQREAAGAICSAGVVEGVYRSAWKGKHLRLDSRTPFYTLALAGAKARAVVRSWNQTSLGAVLRNLHLYFGDIEVVRPKDDLGRARPLLALVRQLAARGDLDALPSDLGNRPRNSRWSAVEVGEST